MTKKQRDALIKRLKNPLFLAALASGLYQLLVRYNVAPDAGTYQLYVDLVNYVLLGAGIYSTFGNTETNTK
ncbi:hypothetical protein [Paenibacillus sp. MMO-177]|uniref:hypothetical protein n=1 Tax=Paenibacillus sp. MMO-177 TaxID=3081289 RepID=UPI0030186F55